MAADSSGVAGHHAYCRKQAVEDALTALMSRAPPESGQGCMRLETKSRSFCARPCNRSQGGLPGGFLIRVVVVSEVCKAAGRRLGIHPLRLPVHPFLREHKQLETAS